MNKCPDAFPILSKAKGGVSQDGFDFAERRGILDR